jgi:membrane-associated phospholipid phosphatase
MLSGLDFTILEWLHDHTIPHSIPVLQFISYTTTFISIAMTLIILATSIVKKSRTNLRQFFTMAAVLIVVLIVSQGLKALIFRDRPFVTHPYIEKLSDAGSSSFPSGHTLEAFAVATALSILFSGKKITVPLYIWATVVAYSRIALGVHYPSDVLAGIIIGTFIGWIVPFMSLWFFPRDKIHLRDTSH